MGNKELKENIKTAIKDGLVNAKSTGPRCGCGRAYVCLCKVEKGTLAAYKSAIEELGLRYLPEAYGAGKRALYVGYDNASGLPLAQAELIAKNLKALGLPAYDDGVGD